MVRRPCKDQPATAKAPVVLTREQKLAAAVAAFKGMKPDDKKIFKELSDRDEQLVLHALDLAKKDFP